MQRSYLSIFRRPAGATELFARCARVLVPGLAAGVAGSLLLRHAGLHQVTPAAVLLGAFAVSLAWLAIAVRPWRAAPQAQPQAQVQPQVHPQPQAQLQPQPRGPSAWQDQAAAPVPRTPADAVRTPPTDAAQQQATIQVVFASQTGFAEQLARQTAQQLQRSGVATRLQALGKLRLADLRAARRVLFVVSTTGEGDAPDDALPFFREYMAQAYAVPEHALPDLEYGILALGDSDYDDFCGFGRKLERWLQGAGARPLFDLVEVDSEDESALRQWQYCLTGLGGDPDQPDWQAPRYQRWQLLERRLLNPGSIGAPCFHVALRPLQDKPRWEAGDLVEIGPCHAAQVVEAWLDAHGLDGGAAVKVGRESLSLRELLARSRLPAADDAAGLDAAGVAAIVQRLPHRAYSIASVPEDGAVHLLVRQARGPDGRLGLGSSWLTEQAAVGAEIAARIRGNANFHAPKDGRPLILVGNGTGVAALRALLKARAAAGHRRNWLVFGERQARHDDHYGAELREWQAGGVLERVDFAWSRDQAEPVYVQHRLREAADVLRQWVDDGAAIYVCGSVATMAPAVDQALRDVLGAARVEQLRGEGRYSRDVY